MNSNDITIHEWIGRTVTMTGASDPQMVGLNGIVIDETRNTITVAGDSGTVSVQKRGSVIDFHEPSGIMTINGDRTLFRPHERPKKIRMK